MYYDRQETPNSVIYTQTIYEFTGPPVVIDTSNKTYTGLYEDEYRFVADEEADNEIGGYLIHSRHLVAIARENQVTGELYVRQNLSYYKWPLVGYIYDGEKSG